MRRQVPTPPAPRPYRVARWGKFWSLEPVHADERAWLVAKGSLPFETDDLVLAVPASGDRRRVVEVLGPADDLKAALRALLAARAVREGFDDDVLEEAAAVGVRAARPDRGRKDVTTVPTFTIDPDTARDFDDAISVQREGDGYRAHVHIADVSYFVDDDGVIDAEARKRTSSLYLPLWAEPMLPAALSSDLCSLKPRRPRKCLTTEFTFDAAGSRTSVQFYRSLISSDHRLTYGFVDGVLDAAGVSEALDAAGGTAEELGRPPAVACGMPGAAPAAVPDATTEAAPELTEQLALAAELAAKLRRRRFARGALRIGSFEPEYGFDETGKLVGAASRPETASHALVEEYMLAANEAVAEFLLKRRARTLFRIHEPPDVRSALELVEKLEELGVPAPSLPDGQLTPAQLGRWYGRVSEVIAATSAREGRGRLAWSNLLLRSLKQAVYSPVNKGHFGLASGGYLHFTSPIRRYPDLVAHRALLHELGEGPGAPEEAELATLGDDCSTMERTMARIELDADDIALTFLLDQRLLQDGWETSFGGEVTGLIPAGLFVRFDGCFEGFLPSRRLGGERLMLSDHETALVGPASGRRYRLGDHVQVRVESLDRVRGRVDLVPAVEGPERPVTASNRRPARRTTGSRPPRRRGPRPPGTHRR